MIGRLPLDARLLRRAGLAGVACAIAVALLLGPLTSGRHGGAAADSTYRVDAVFDTAKGIIPGQLVKIAGARVGEIDDVVLTPDFKARIQMKVDRRFAPFRQDAKCEIQPEGLISERFVQCDPGTPDAPALVGKGDQAATVPVDHTSVPVAITDLFNIFRVPIRQRFSVIVATLGIGLAGRGDDLNEILRRANPTLDLTRKALTILGSQKRALADTVRAADKLSADLAKRPQSVSRFLDDAAAVSQTTSEHSSQLQEAIRRLPALLDETQPTLGSLNEVAASGTPVLDDLRTATPALSSLVDQIKPFSDAGRPAVGRLAAAAKTGRSTLTAARPVVKLLRTFASAAGPTGRDLNRLLVNLQATGGVENLLQFVYAGAAAAARYDGVSHLVPAHAFIDPRCSFYATKPVPGCSANYGEQPAARKATAPKAKTPAKQAAPAGSAPEAPQATAPEAPAQAPEKGSATTTIQVPGLPPVTIPSIPGILDSLGGGAKDGQSDSVSDVLDYLLGS